MSVARFEADRKKAISAKKEAESEIKAFTKEMGKYETKIASMRKEFDKLSKERDKMRSELRKAVKQGDCGATSARDSGGADSPVGAAPQCRYTGASEAET